ncbi:MAG TPA: efflux RND transporter permease subunit [Cyclobacteriaceae bacterium]|nr:efflux RND transporter permease subunit [Cyclobacteriaceae bacterium]
MNLIRFALRKPISVLVLVAGLFFFGVRAVNDIKIDILPRMDLPVIYIAHPFGGYSPTQMETYFAKNYNNILLFANGVKSIEAKNIQGLTLMKLTYYEGTNMAQAAAEVSALANRAQNNFPPGSTPPFVIRFDASSLPVGQLVLSSETRTNNELQDMANVYVRASFTSIPGLIAPAPFGGSVRTIEINVDPELLRSHNLTPDQIVEAIRLNNQTAPGGNIRIGDTNYITPTNNTLREVKDFENIPLFKGAVQNLYLRDVATVVDGADVPAGYALVNGKRSVYISIAKSADASTWDVVKQLKAALPRIESTLPEDVKLSYEFDQSVYVINAVQSLVIEGAIGAILTGLMVLLFLRDPRGALIVILTIPTSVIAGVLCLRLFGHTINIMTLSGLALAIGILVDESTVTIENIHQHLAMGKPKAVAIWDACREIALPKLLILFCILSVFAPAFTMGGIPGALFWPLALAIGCTMIMSFILSQTFVPVMANWLMKHDEHDNHSNEKLSMFDRFKIFFLNVGERMYPARRITAIAYLVGTTGIAALLLATIGTDVLPRVNSSQFQMRLRAPNGTRIERTEDKVRTVLGQIESIVGKDHVSISSVYVGQHPATFSISAIYMFTAGPHEAVFQVALKDFEGDIDDFKDQVRSIVKENLPDVKVTFEAMELTEKVLSQGSPTPIEIRVMGRNKKTNQEYAQKVVDKLKQIDYFRDVQIAQPTDYPALNIDIDRTRAAQLGVDMNDISRSLIAATSSSRYTEKNTWVDERQNLSYLVQVQVPLNQMQSEEEIKTIPLLRNSPRPVLGDVATITPGSTYGENDNLGAISFLSVTANVHEHDLGTAQKAVKEAIASIGELPRGLFVEPVGLGMVLDETLSSLGGGLLVAVVVIFLMLAANFQSFRVSFIVLTAVPAVVLGSILMLVITGSTLNLQSYMGIIMSVGVSIANGVLLITNAEQIRKRTGNAVDAAREAVTLRLRPIIMTSIAMIAGMLPMAIGHGEGGGQVSPLGRAVIGGLLFSTAAVLTMLPLIFSWIQGKQSTTSVSLDPTDRESRFYTENQ